MIHIPRIGKIYTFSTTKKVYTKYLPPHLVDHSEAKMINNRNDILKKNTHERIQMEALMREFLKICTNSFASSRRVNQTRYCRNVE